MGNIDYTLLSDLELINLYKSDNDDKAFKALLQRYYHLIYGACFKILSQEDDAKDCCLEVCQNLLKSIKTAKIQHFNKWLFSVCNNACISYIRKREVRLKHEKNSTFISEKSGDNYVENEMIERLSPKEVDPLENINTEKLVEELLAQLPEAQRRCLQFFFFKKMSYAEIAKTTNTDLKTVKSHLQSGKIRLKRLIDATIKTQ